jgi:hypothetical protein
MWRAGLQPPPPQVRGRSPSGPPMHAFNRPSALRTLILDNPKSKYEKLIYFLVNYVRFSTYQNCNISHDTHTLFYTVALLASSDLGIFLIIYFINFTKKGRLDTVLFGFKIEFSPRLGDFGGLPVLRAANSRRH